MYQLYANPNSGHSYKVALMLQLTGTPFKLKFVDLTVARGQREASFQEQSAFGEVPVLISNGEALCQSNQILLYLCDEIGALGGLTAADKRRAIEWLFWEANRIGFSVPNLRFYAKFRDEFPNALKAYLMQRAIADLTVLSKELETKPFLVGSTLTIADISCCAYLFWLNDTGINIDDWPQIKAWLARIENTPNWRAPSDLL